MANSGYTDVPVTSYDTLRFSWWKTDQSIADNYTKIAWGLYLISGSHGYISSTADKAWNITVNGSHYEGTTKVGIGNNTEKTLASGETIIYHNADGSKHFSYSFNQYFGITFSGSSIGTVSGSGSEWLEPIYRKAEITSAPDFTDMDTSYTVGFNNPAGSAVILKACISWTGGDDITYRELSWYQKENGYYTFDFTDDELNKLRNATLSGSTWRYVTVYITTFSSDGSLIDYSTKKVKFTVIDCEPELNPTVIDVGTASTELTGNPNTLIRGFNCVNVAFNATAKKGASIIEKSVTCGNKKRDSDGNFGDGISDFLYDNEFIFTVTDNRGQTVSETVTMTPVIDYVAVTVNAEYETVLSYNAASINVTLSGNYFNGSFGAKDNNLDLQYIYRKSTEDFPKDENGDDKWTKVESPTLVDNKYTASFTIENINYKDTYIIKAWVADAVYTGGIYAKEQIVKIIPVFDWGENDFNFNVPVNFGDSANFGETDFNFKVPVRFSDGVDNTNRVVTLYNRSSDDPHLDYDHINELTTLYDSIDNYYMIEVVYSANAWGHHKQSVKMRIGFNQGWIVGDTWQNMLSLYTGEYITFSFVNENTIKLISCENQNAHIAAIYGWRW